MSLTAYRLQKNRKRTAREIAKEEDTKEHRAKLCLLFEETYRKCYDTPIVVNYKDGYYILGKSHHKIRESALMDEIERMQKAIELEEHMASLREGGEPGTGEEGWPG